MAEEVDPPRNAERLRSRLERRALPPILADHDELGRGVGLSEDRERLGEVEKALVRSEPSDEQHERPRNPVPVGERRAPGAGGRQWPVSGGNDLERRESEAE